MNPDYLKTVTITPDDLDRLASGGGVRLPDGSLVKVQEPARPVRNVLVRGRKGSMWPDHVYFVAEGSITPGGEMKLTRHMLLVGLTGKPVQSPEWACFEGSLQVEGPRASFEVVS